MVITVIEQDKGVIVYQVSECLLEKSNIYCELPCCSADLRVFV